MFSLPDDLKKRPVSVNLIAVTKQQDDADIDAALSAGLRHFGENRLQEAKLHWEDRRKNYPDLTLHMIGPLQSNKAREAVALFDVIHTLDREKIVHALKDEMNRAGKNLSCFIQVNTGLEPQKAGVEPNMVPAFYAMCRKAGVNIIGLMCIPPVGENPTPHFQLLRTLGIEVGVAEFSMGMSADYQAAIVSGATYIRIGSALFGERH